MTPSFSHAFIFDLDGVITDTARLHLAAWHGLARRLGLPFDPAMEARLRGLSRMDSLDLILGDAASRFSTERKQALADHKNAAYVESLGDMSAADLLPGALAALQAVRDGGWGLALASASMNAHTVLQRLGIAPLFHHVVDVAAIARGKPAPDIFLAAAQALGVPPAHCVGIEDAAAGIAAVRSAGMFALGIGDPLALPEADRVLPGLDAFRPTDFLH
ncbi:beta-phosphoglucomutase [Pseudorhodoferax sp.]|uniref:beta-phosphoglucomutase n=1 Tax=Pseudorhodoferax sp. TaxID=1993553 RepID=UPI002DD63708|nr:beta-phosphoglucomutase [Pseudorhodoferax sp.]